jgi:hypothetical protein
MAVIVWILAHATAREYLVLCATFAAATLLYGLRHITRQGRERRGARDAA